MRVLIRSVPWIPERAENARALAILIPSAEIVWDTEPGDSYQNMIRALRIAGDESCLHLEDDITPTENFMAKVVERVNARYGPYAGAKEVHQFFSKRAADLEQGTRLIPGRDFSFTCAFYLPAGMADAADFLERWPKRAAKPSWYDYALADYFSKHRRSYYNHVPSLVQHNRWKSSIDPRRGTTNRQSPTFVP